MGTILFFVITQEGCIGDDTGVGQEDSGPNQDAMEGPSDAGLTDGRIAPDAAAPDAGPRVDQGLPPDAHTPCRGCPSVRG